MKTTVLVLEYEKKTCRQGTCNHETSWIHSQFNDTPALNSPTTNNSSKLTVTVLATSHVEVFLGQLSFPTYKSPHTIHSTFLNPMSDHMNQKQETLWQLRALDAMIAPSAVLFNSLSATSSEVATWIPLHLPQHTSRTHTSVHHQHHRRFLLLSLKKHHRCWHSYSTLYDIWRRI